MIKIIFIYLIGLILTYILRRYVVRKYKSQFKKESYESYYTWDDVLRNILISFTSWIGFVVLLIMIFTKHIADWADNSEPPKYL